MEIEIDGIEAETIDAALQPEAGDIEQFFLNFRIMQVEIGLRGQEVVHVILHAGGVPLPAGAAEDRQPVVGRRAIRLAVRPDIPVRFRIVAAGAAFHEPWMLVRGMRHDEIDHHADAETVGFRDQPVEIGQCAEHRIDIDIVRDVVTEILHRRGEERRNPDGVRAETGNMRQPVGDALEIADAVAIGVLIGARVDLIDHGAAPPILVGCQSGSHRSGHSLILSGMGVHG
ncbi:hypothetical protein D3C78_1189560 [compost metagenome]